MSPLVIGSDSPHLPSVPFDDARAALGGIDADRVFGPMVDGGYDSIGAPQSPERVVTDVQMSTSTVRAEPVGSIRRP